MKDSQILSTFEGLSAAEEPPAPRAALVFDACHPGVVIRAVLFVQATLAVGAMFGADDGLAWLTRMALLTGGALPATLAWLLLACGLKRPLARLARRGHRVHYPAGALLGVLAGLLACAIPWAAGLSVQAPWWASAATGLLLAVLLVAGLELRSRSRAPAAAAARLTELQARIRPHFLFNTLNSAIALVRAEPALAEAMLEDLSDLFRHALVDHGESVALEQEIALAERYLAIEQVRFGNRLRVQWTLDARAGSARLPPLLLQPLVENAVKHGVEPSAEGAELQILTEQRGAVVVVKVSNTVPAGQGLVGMGMALENVRMRLDLLHDVQARFQAGLRDGVFQVRIELPNVG